MAYKRYEITIKETVEENVAEGSGFTSVIGKTVEITRVVFSQYVDSLNLVAVIKAVNGI